MRVVIITEEQKDLIKDKPCGVDLLFNPIPDGNGNWLISEQEQQSCQGSEFNFLRDLPVTEWLPAKQNTSL